MISWKQYLKVQLKRAGKALPGICLLTVFLTVGLLVLMKAMFLIEESKKMRFCDFLFQGHRIGNALLNENEKLHEEGASPKS